MYGYFNSGGPLMWVLFIMSIIASSIVIEKILYLLKTEKRYHRIFKQKVVYLVGEGKMEAAIKLSKTENNAIGRTLAEFLTRVNLNGDFHHFEQLIKEIEFKELGGIERHLHILGIIATTSPMIGLLGTVTGMISAFTQMSAAGGGGASLVAKGISIALITTASGLIVAIPSMITYNLLIAKTEEISEEIDKITTSIVNVIRR
ncbi:MAG: MotA/TolQ/ExbB proton channel family protein [Fusobacteriaceae bacterium]